jgi:hypothetical protein
MKEKLKTLFRNTNTDILKDYSDILHSDFKNKLIPKPYIPRIGDFYSNYKILFYGKAQNKPPQSSFNEDTWIEHLNKKSYKDVWIAPFYIMLSLAGVYLKINNIQINGFDEIDKYVAATNYYKYSLKKNKKDLNPDNLNGNCKDAKPYFQINDSLVKSEINVLKPNVIFTFRGRQEYELKRIIKELELSTKIIVINDPAWILRGSNGCLKKGGSWDIQIQNEEVIQLVNGYLKNFDSNKYKSKIKDVEIYLKKYFHDWNTETYKQDFFKHS